MTFEAGLADTVRWYVEHRGLCRPSNRSVRYASELGPGPACEPEDGIGGRARRQVARGAPHMKGIILAGGTGSRLYPADPRRQQAAAAGLQQADDLLPAVGADAGGHPRRPHHHDAARSATTSGACWATARSWGIRIELRRAAQPRRPGPGVPHRASVRGRATAWRSPSGDNIFYGAHLSDYLRARRRRADVAPPSSATRCGIPQRYGVVEFDAAGRAVSLEEKPARPKSAVRGHRACTSTTTRSSTSRRDAAAVGARRAGDHRRQPRLPRARQPARREAGARHRLARHRHARVAAAGGATTSRPSRNARG